MSFTEEQKKILQAVQEPENTFIKVNSVAGSGKTTVLVEISNILKPKNGVYLAYNKAIATEAGSKFSKGTSCMTTHSLAYQNTIKPFNLSIGFFNYKDIKERIPYEHKIMMIDSFKEFCLSEFVKFDVFVDYKKKQITNMPESIYALIRKYFTAMTKGQIPITHDAYLKFYHLLLVNKKIVHKEFDLLMLDEAGDLNMVTLAIFNALPAKKKIMVGDENQNIYTFNNTVNGFDIMRDKGIQLNMTQSFRCSSKIAKGIEAFCQQHIRKSMQFKGRDYDILPEIKTRAYITRNNSALVGKMIELQAIGTKYNLTRKSKVIFELLLILLSLKPGGKIYSGEWKYLQQDVNEWDKFGHLQMDYNTPLKYIASLYGSEPGVSSAINIITKYGPGEIFAAYETSKKHETEKGHNYTLCTAHSSKGLEFDEVIIAEDLNEATLREITGEGAMTKHDKYMESMRLYYVACSRALYSLKGAKLIPMDEPGS